MKDYQTTNKLAKTFYSLENFLSSITMVIILIFVFSATIMRYFFSSSIVGLEELTVVIAIYCYFLGAACSSRDGTQIRVNIIDELMEHSRFNYLFHYFRSLLTIAISIIFLYVSIIYGNFVLDKNLNLAPLGFSKMVAVASMIAGFSLISIHEIFRLIRFIKTKRINDKNRRAYLAGKGEIKTDE